jgi:UDP-N-acetylmuramate--alanine ligase
MIGLMLETAGLDPLVIVGTKVKEWGGNIRVQSAKCKVQSCSSKLKVKIQNDIFVVEADEYRSAMLNLHPDMIVLTRVEEDHLDYYRDLTHIKQEFKKYVKRLPQKGVVVANWKDENIQSIVKLLHCYIVRYNYRDEEIKKKIKKIIKVIGEHNVENALAAYKVGEVLGLSENQILTGLSKFRGTWRRMELVGYYKLQATSYKLPIVSDYAHHPTEIKATLQALREKYPKKRLVLAYQPHQHNRTKKLFVDFVSAFDDVDVLILNEIFDVVGREELRDQDVSSKDLMWEIRKRIKKLRNLDIKKLRYCYYSRNLKQTERKILELARQNDIIIIMGAGDIDKVARELVL